MSPKTLSLLRSLSVCQIFYFWGFWLQTRPSWYLRVTERARICQDQSWLASIASLFKITITFSQNKENQEISHLLTHLLLSNDSLLSDSLLTKFSRFSPLQNPQFSFFPHFEIFFKHFRSRDQQSRVFWWMSSSPLSLPSPLGPWRDFNTLSRRASKFW